MANKPNKPNKPTKECLDCKTKVYDYYPSYSKDKTLIDKVRCSKCHEKFVRTSNIRDYT
ncbi:multiheme c-type cytochrome [bacterium]|nr:multiheme c-type cytochrome [bacterium]